MSKRRCEDPVYITTWRVDRNGNKHGSYKLIDKTKNKVIQHLLYKHGEVTKYIVHNPIDLEKK